MEAMFQNASSFEQNLNNWRFFAGQTQPDAESNVNLIPFKK